MTPYGEGIFEVEPPATCSCKLQPNRQSYAATWRIRTSDSAFCQITLVLIIITIIIIWLNSSSYFVAYRHRNLPTVAALDDACNVSWLNDNMSSWQGNFYSIITYKLQRETKKRFQFSTFAYRHTLWTICGKTVLLKIPPHLKRVAILPCGIWIFKKLHRPKHRNGKPSARERKRNRDRRARIKSKRISGKLPHRRLVVK